MADLQDIVPGASLSGQALQFTASGQLFCIQLEYIMRVIRLVALQTIPGTPSYFKGLLDLHGENIFIMDLADRLCLKERMAYTINTPIILCEHGDNKAGLVVDEVLGVEAMGEIEKKMLSFSDSKVQELLFGTMKTSKGSALLLNIDTLFNIGLSVTEKQLSNE